MVTSENRRSGRARIDDIKAALSLKDTIEKLANVRFQGGNGKYKGCCPFHSEKTPSFQVDEIKGRYRCFGAGCGRGGDVIQFIADWNGIAFPEALAIAGEMAGVATENAAARPRRRIGETSFLTPWNWFKRKWFGPNLRRATEFLPPASGKIAVPPPGEKVRVRDDARERWLDVTPTHIHEYRDPEGRVLCVIFRCRKEEGGKFFIQARWSGRHWDMVRIPRGTGRPIYGQADIPAWSQAGGDRILIVEGETTRDAAARFLPAAEKGWLCLTTMGGANAVAHADWMPLASELAHRKSGLVRIFIWPDADLDLTDHKGQVTDRQQAFATAVANSVADGLIRPKPGCKVECHGVSPPSGVASGWDLADAADQGWTSERVLERIDDQSRLIRALN